MKTRTPASLLVAITAITTVLAGAAGAEPAAPGALSATGLYDARGAIAPHNIPFVPQYPLWTDGAQKSRWIHLPAGTRVDVSNIDAWRFPPGTKVWKQFSWNGRKIETRMMWKPADTWIYATYVWSDDQSDAYLAPDSGVPGAYEVAAGKQHSIPAIEDCTACHASAPSPVLGFSALQLSDDRDPLAPHAEPLPPGAATLSSLVNAQRLEPAPIELVRRPPRIEAPDPKVRAALGYLSGNCGSCHNRTGPLARLGFDLLHAPDTALGAPTRFTIPGVAPADTRIVAPGAPEHSALLYRMRSRRPSSQMPPLGTALPDGDAVELVRHWIATR